MQQCGQGCWIVFNRGQRSNLYDDLDKSFHWLDKFKNWSLRSSWQIYFLALFSRIQLPTPPITTSFHWYLTQHSASLLQSAKLILIRAEVIMQVTEALQQFRLTLKLWLQNYIFWWSLSHAYSWSFPLWYTTGDTQANQAAKTANEIGRKVNEGLERDIKNFQTWFHLWAVSGNCHTLFICDKQSKLGGLGRRKYRHR